MEKGGKKVSVWSSIKDFVYDLFNRGIPSDEVQAMHESWRVPIAAVIYASFVAMFIAFLVTGYQKYIDVRSLSYAPYTSLEAYTQFVPEGCDAIPISVTGDYYASDNGYWSGSSSNFDYSSGIYQFSMSSFSNQDNLYTYLMQGVQQAFTIKGEIAKQFNLAYNIVLWMTYVVIDVQLLGQSNRFFLTATPLVVFEREKYVTKLASKNGVCNATSVTTLDTGTGEVSIIFNYDEIQSSELCSNAINPAAAYNLGYRAASDGKSLQIKYNIATYIVNILTPGVELEAIKSLELIYDNKTVSFYNDPKFPAMEPLLCINTTDSYVCAIQVSDGYLLPVFNHMGYNTSSTTPTYCDCANPNYFDYLIPCNFFNFFVGFLYFSNISDPNSLLTIANTYAGTQLSDAAYNSTYYSFFGNDEADLSESFEFCKSEYGYCHLLTTAIYDVSTNGLSYHSVSDNFYQVKFGSCNNSINIGDSAWDRLIANPPTPLVNEYVTCKPNSSTIFISQAGIATGNAGIMFPVSIIVIVVLLHVYQACSGRIIPTGYKTSEKQEVLDNLATALLLLRDQCLNGVDSQTLDKLYTELNESSKIDQYATREHLKVNWDVINKMHPFRAKDVEESSLSSLSVSLTEIPDVNRITGVDVESSKK